MAYAMGMSWHEGEKEMHRIMKVPRGFDNATAPGLTMQASNMLLKAPLLAVGTLDKEERPWTTVWGGTYGFSRAIGGSLIGVRTPVDAKNDPVVQALFRDNSASNDSSGKPAQGKMVSGLTQDLETGKRVKLYGRMAACALSESPQQDDRDDKDDKDVEAQLVVRIDQSLGNCPKYANSKHLEPASTSKSELLSESTTLSPEAKAIVASSDLFFLSSSNADKDMDTNHRGGPVGFVRVHDVPGGASQIIWPEYSGNRMYQSLGNLRTTPRAGLVFPDFISGNVLYLTGTTEILAGKEASSLMPRSNLVVRLTITVARLVRAGLPFRGTIGKRSPYNPKVRPLTSEVSKFADAIGGADAHSHIATLIDRTQLTPDVYRLKFSLDKPASWSTGQWVALDLSAELDEGYSHMRDDDPLSLNDDWIRTFTVSSQAPTSKPGADCRASTDTFEITLRAVGPVTRFLVRQNPRAGLEVPVAGFGGDFEMIQDQSNTQLTPFIAAGVGITPLIAAIPCLDLQRLVLLWTVRQADLALVIDTLNQFPVLGMQTRVFLTSKAEIEDERVDGEVEKIRATGAKVDCRRLTEADVRGIDAQRWYVCAGSSLKDSVTSWLDPMGREVIDEEFTF